MTSHLLIAIGQDPMLRHVKLIAEPWDASMDGYRVGEFPPPWIEWNDQFRDEIRDFWLRGTAGHPQRRDAARRLVRPVRRRRPLAVRLGQLRHRARRVHRARPRQLRPQAQRGQRRAEPGRHRQQPVLEPRRRGRDRPTRRSSRLRRRGAANLMATLCLSNGVPMITAGDERGRTQGGNNNPYCQDNETSWIDWRPRRRLARRLRDHQGRAAAAPRPPGAAPAALVRGPAHDPRRTQGPGLAAPGRPRDDRRRLARPRSSRRSACSSPASRCVPPARTASSRSTRRSCMWFNAGRANVPITLARERLGRGRRGRALHRPAAAGGHPGQGRRPAHAAPPVGRGAARDLTHRWSRPGKRGTSRCEPGQRRGRAIAAGRAQRWPCDDGRARERSELPAVRPKRVRPAATTPSSATDVSSALRGMTRTV